MSAASILALLILAMIKIIITATIASRKRGEMPATSKAQREAMAIAEHHPDKLHKANKGMLNMSHEQLHDFASTSEKHLPERKAHHEHSKKYYDKRAGGR